MVYTFTAFDERQRQRRKEIESRPLFGTSQVATSSIQSPPNSKVTPEDKIEEQKKRLGIVISSQMPSPFSGRRQKQTLPASETLIKSSSSKETTEQKLDLHKDNIAHTHQSGNGGLSDKNQQSTALHSLISEYAESDESADN